MTDDPSDPSDTDQDTAMRDDATPDTPPENTILFNARRDFNDAAPQIDVFGDSQQVEGGDRRRPAHRLDPMLRRVTVDEGDHDFDRRSSSARAK